MAEKRGFSLGTVGWLILCPFIALLLHLVFAFTLWPDGPAGQQRLAQREAKLLVAVLGERTQLPAATAAAANEWMAVVPSGEAAPTNSPFVEVDRRLSASLESFFGALGVSLWLVALRIGVLLLALPLFVLAMGVGLTDGWALRVLRRAGGARESSFVYHRAKLSAKSLVLTTCFIYLMLPVALDPRMILLPAALAMALSMRVAMGYFKKYL